jgi:hypothetical protein
MSPFHGASTGNSCGSGQSADEISEGRVNFVSFSFEARELSLAPPNSLSRRCFSRLQRQSPRTFGSESSERAQQFVSVRGQRRPIALRNGLADRLHNLRRVLVKNQTSSLINSLSPSPCESNSSRR